MPSMNFNVVTCFTPAQRKELKKIFQDNRRMTTLMNKVAQDVERSVPYKTKVTVNHSVMKRP